MSKIANNRRSYTLFLFLLVLIIAAPQLQAQAVRTNAGFRTNSIPRNDDGSTGLVNLGFTINFFGRQRSQAYVNNNGNITFDSALPNYTPEGLVGSQREIIAAFFADVDTRAAGSSLVTYGTDTVDGRPAFGVNYVNVGYYGSHDDKLNSFQLILIDRSDTGAGNFDIEFNYDRLLWETGDASGGTNGFGGTSAAAGYSNGSGAPGTSLQIPGSLVNGALLDSSPTGLANNLLNSNVRGRWIFPARSGGVGGSESLNLCEANNCSPRALNLTAAAGSAATRHTIQFDIPASTTLAFSIAHLNGSNWLSVTPASATFQTGLNFVTLTVNYAAMGTPGVYQAVLTGSDARAGVSARIPVTVVLLPNAPRVLLSHSALVFQTVQSGATPPPQSVTVANGGTGSLSWSIPANPAPWLTVSPTSGGPGQAATFSVNPAGLAAGVYQAAVPVSASGASNSPQTVSVTLHVAPSNTPAVPTLSASGMLFVSVPGAPAPPSQTITVSNAGSGSASFQASATTSTGGNWLTVTPTSGNVSTTSATVQVNVAAAAVPDGLHRGRITFTFTPGGTRTVDVLLAITRSAISLAACTPTTFDLVGTTLSNGLALPVSFPKVLVALAVDSCGIAVPDATVVVSADGNNIPLQTLGNGLYSGVWTPQRASTTIGVTLTASTPAFPAVVRRTSYSVSAAAAPGGVALPSLSQDGVVEGAAFSPRRPLVPGGIISLFGTNLASATVAAQSVPLPAELAGASVRIGGQPAPLYFVSAGQINAQVPFEVAPGSTPSIVVTSTGRITAPQNYAIADAQPAIFKVNPTTPAILDSQSRLVTAANPAVIGDTLQIYATGLGLTDVSVPSGSAATGLSNVRVPVTVIIGGVQATVSYQGLAPNFVGLYQVNAVIPATVTPGDAVSVVIRQNGVLSNPDSTVLIPVRR